MLSDVLEGKLGALGSRIGRLLFKQTVDLDLIAHILAAVGEFNMDAMERTRGQCVQHVKQTNGGIDLMETLRKKEL